MEGALLFQKVGRPRAAQTADELQSHRGEPAGAARMEDALPFQKAGHPPAAQTADELQSHREEPAGAARMEDALPFQVKMAGAGLTP